MAGTSITAAIDEESVLHTADDGLNNRQRLFVNYYCSSLNAYHAAKMAGYTGSRSVIARTGSENLYKPLIANAINARLQQYGMAATEILARLTDLARADMTLGIDNSGDIDVKQLRRMGKGHWIKKYKRRTYTRTGQDGNEEVVTETELELHDSLEALKYMGKFHGLVYNRLKIEIDWESQAIAAIQAGHISYSALAAAFDRQQATKLFLAAKVPIPGQGDIEEAQYTELDTAEDSPAAPLPVQPAPSSTDTVEQDTE